MAKYNYTPISGGQYLDWDGLTEFWKNLKQYISTENAKQNGTNIFMDSTSTDTIADRISDMSRDLQNLDGKVNGISGKYVASVKGSSGEYVKIAPLEATTGDVELSIDDTDLKEVIDGLLAEKKVNSLYVEGDEDIYVEFESDGDAVNGYLTGNVSIKVDSSKLAGRVSSLETGTIKTVSAADTKDGGNDYVNISSSTENGEVSITLDDTKLSQAISGIDTSYKDYSVNDKKFSSNNGSVTLDSTDIKHGGETISNVLTSLANKAVVAKIESGDSTDDLVKINVNANTGDVTVSIDETNLASQLATAGDHSDLINSADVKGSNPNTVTLAVDKHGQELVFTLGTEALSNKISGYDTTIGDLQDSVGDLEATVGQHDQTLQNLTQNVVNSIGGQTGVITLGDNVTTPGNVKFSIVDQEFKGEVIGLGTGAYDNFIEATEDQIKAIIGEIIPGPSGPEGAATPEDIGGLFPNN